MKKVNNGPPASDRIGIYLIECVSSNTVYIGQSYSLDKRIRSHKRLLKYYGYSKVHKKMQEDYNKFGEDNFRFSVIMNCELCDLLRYEAIYIKYYERMGYKLYNKVLDSRNTIITCSREYSDLLTRIAKDLERGNIKKEDIERGLYS